MWFHLQDPIHVHAPLIAVEWLLLEASAYLQSSGSHQPSLLASAAHLVLCVLSSTILVAAVQLCMMRPSLQQQHQRRASSIWVSRLPEDVHRQLTATSKQAHDRHASPPRTAPRRNASNPTLSLAEPGQQVSGSREVPAERQAAVEPQQHEPVPPPVAAEQSRREEALKMLFDTLGPAAAERVVAAAERQASSVATDGLPQYEGRCRVEPFGLKVSGSVLAYSHQPSHRDHEHASETGSSRMIHSSCQQTSASDD